MTLRQVLEGLGYALAPDPNPKALYTKAVCRGSQVVWTGTADACWKWLRATGQID